LYKKNQGEDPIQLFKVSDTSYLNKENDELIFKFIYNLESKEYDMISQYHSGYVESKFIKIKENTN